MGKKQRRGVGKVKIELGPMRIARIIGESVRRYPNGSVDMTVRWEDETEGNNARGVVHLHEREVGMITAAVGKRDLNGRDRR